MNDNKGMVLVLALFIILVLAGLSASFLYKQVNQSFISNRYADSIRALWVAEGGLQAARNNNLGHSSLSGTLGGGTYAVTITNLGNNYYQVVSTGSVGGVSRTITAVVSTRDVDATKFRFGLQSSVDISFKGSSTVYGENTTTPVPNKYRDPNYYQANSVFSFADLFGFSTTEIKGISTWYNNSWPSGTVSGLNWVTAPSSHFNGNVAGDGILIIEGNLRVTGTIDFDGIIYVIGTLDMAGTALVNGTILAESAASVDTDVAGTADIKHNTTAIANALNNIAYRSPQVVSWKEAE